VCNELLRQGAVVHATSRSGQPGDGRLYWHVADFSKPAAAMDVITRIQPEVIFHLAGYVNGARDLSHVMPSFEANCLATVNLLLVATKLQDCRVVLAHSLEEPDVSEAENAPCSPYAASKFAGTVYARMFHALYGTHVAITRIAMGYGPGQWDSKKLIPYVILSLLKGKAPDLSSGKRCCDWVYIEDVVRGMLLAASSPRCAGQTLDLASGALTSLRTVVLQIVELLGSSITPNFGALPDRPLERLRPADIEKTRALTGWEPATSLHAGLAATIEWYRQERSLSCEHQYQHLH
jgi:nucleoside-diphosphate-sugar epimerase